MSNKSSYSFIENKVSNCFKKCSFLVARLIFVKKQEEDFGFGPEGYRRGREVGKKEIPKTFSIWSNDKTKQEKHPAPK